MTVEAEGQTELIPSGVFQQGRQRTNGEWDSLNGRLDSDEDVGDKGHTVTLLQWAEVRRWEFLANDLTPDDLFVKRRGV